MNAPPDTGQTSRSQNATVREKPPCGGNFKASGQPKPDGQAACGRGIAEVDRGGGGCEKTPQQDKKDLKLQIGETNPFLCGIIT